MKIGKNFHCFILAIMIIMFVILIPAAPSLALTGTINISPSSGPVGTSVTVTGSGFTPSSAYTVKFEEAVVALGNVSNAGSFVTTGSIPPYPRGMHQVTVTTSESDISNSESFTVIPSINTDVSLGHVGDQINVSGDGFAPYSNIDVYFDNANIGSALTNSRGSFFAATITVPQTAEGDHSISGSDGIYAPTATFQVIPYIELSPAPELVGDNINVTGTGYAADVEVYFYIDGDPVVTIATTDNNGSFTANNFTIPALRRGNHALRVRDERYNTATIMFSIKQGLTVNPTDGSSGTVVTLNGSGFSENRIVTIDFGSLNISSINPLTITTDAEGSFTATFTVTASRGGTYTITATDDLYSAASNFSITGSATLSSITGSVGSTITVNGSSFLADDMVVIRFEGSRVASATTDNLGNFSTTFKIPGSPSGKHILTVADNTNTVTINFVVVPDASLNYYRGYVNSAVIVSGTGFVANSSTNIDFDSSYVTTATTNLNGEFSTDFTVPNSWGGDHHIIISDGTNQTSLIFTVLASAELSPQSVNVGTDVAVSGSGFATSGMITIHYDDEQVRVTTADTKGSFSANFPAPASPGGKHTATVSDGINSVTLTFNMMASITLDPTSGYVGSSVIVRGYGFAVQRAVTINYSGNPVSVVTSDDNGSFSAMFKAPASKGGDHNISATDGTSAATAVFSMDSTPLAAPTPFMPLGGTEEDLQTSFVWSPVTDPSGVTYTLEAATDLTFQNIVLEKNDLKDAEYTLASSEELKPVSQQNPYYWRVRAVDGVGNESPWTAPQSFYIGFVLSKGGLYAIFGVGAIILALFTFWLGRKTKETKL